MTWQQLKDFANSLPEDQLQKEVIWLGDETGGKITEAIPLKEDYVNMGYGYEPISVYEEEADFDKDDAEGVLDAGTPVLYTP